MAQKDLGKQEFAQAASVFFRYLAEMAWDQFHTVTIPSGGLVLAAPPPPKAVSRQEAADLLDVSPSTIDSMVKAGKLHPVKVHGQHKRYPLDQIESILKKRE